MHDPQLFRRQLAARLLGLLGAASLASCTSGGGKRAGSMVDAGTTAATTTATTGGTGGAGGKGSSASTGSTGGAEGTGGASGAGGAGSGGGGTGGASEGNPPVQECFDPSALADAGVDAGVVVASADGGGCPVDPAVVLADFLALNCPYGWEPYQIASGPTGGSADSQCCYLVVNHLCTGGGRPYLVGDRARIAATHQGTGSHGWAAGEGPSPDALALLTAGERAALAAAWTADAVMEHASVASFARFSLALLAAGAPADLVELAHRAALDEVRHARLCFALAAAYAGDAIAPGPFPLGAEVHVGSGLAALATSTVKEGCVGETVAAILAAEQLARATDPAVRAALARIAADEARHAELAWRTVAWAVHAGGSDVRAAVEQTLLEAFAERGATPAVESAGSRAMEAHGRLDAATAARVVASAMADVVGPAARALLERAGDSPAGASIGFDARLDLPGHESATDW
jgi:hypothetical protein